MEDCFAEAKNEAGLDHYQVRRYRAWYRHVTLAMLAHAFLAVTARRPGPGRRNRCLPAADTDGDLAREGALTVCGQLFAPAEDVQPAAGRNR